MVWGLRKFPKVHYLPCVRVDFPKLRLAWNTAWGLETRKQKCVCMCVCVYGGFLHFLWGAERQTGQYTQTSICILRVCFTVERLNSEFKRELKENKRCVYMCVCVYGVFPHFSWGKKRRNGSYTPASICILRVCFTVERLKSHFKREFARFSA